MEEMSQRNGGKPCTHHRMRQMFAAADLNHNGVVDFNEFCFLQQKKRSREAKSRSRRSSPASSVVGDDTPRSWPFPGSAPGSVSSTPRTWRQHGQNAIFGGAELAKPASSLGYLWLPPALPSLEEARSQSACP